MRITGQLGNGDWTISDAGNKLCAYRFGLSIEDSELEVKLFYHLSTKYKHITAVELRIHPSETVKTTKRNVLGCVTNHSTLIENGHSAIEISHSFVFTT